jgi:hypothetical protein
LNLPSSRFHHLTARDELLHHVNLPFVSFRWPGFQVHYRSHKWTDHFYWDVGFFSIPVLNIVHGKPLIYIIKDLDLEIGTGHHLASWQAWVISLGGLKGVKELLEQSFCLWIDVLRPQANGIWFLSVDLMIPFWLKVLMTF